MRQKSFLKYYPFGSIVLLCGFYIYKAINFAIHDFANYYFGASFLAEDNFDSAIYFPYQFSKAVTDLGFENIFVSYAPNTPFLAFLFLPFTFVSVFKAKIIFNILSSILLVIGVKRLFSFFKISYQYLILIPILFFVPIKNNLLFGQVYFLLFFLLVEVLIAYEKKQYYKLSVFLSIAILLKVFPVVFVMIFVFRKEIKPLFYTFVSCVLLFGLSSIFTGFDTWFFVINKVLPKASNGEIAGDFVDNYQSIFMFLKRLLIFNVIENKGALFNHPILFSNLVLLFKLLLIVVGFFLTKVKSKIDHLNVFIYWIFVSLLISPYGSTYGFIVLIFAFVSILKSLISFRSKIFMLLLLFIINNFPLSYVIKYTFPFSYGRLLFFLLFFITFLYPFTKKINWKFVTLIAIMPVAALTFMKPTQMKYQPFIKEQQPLLIYDYDISNHQMTYYYWNENGENAKTVPLIHSEIKRLDLKNNQIFYKNKQLTFDKGNKLKPILIDNQSILFLSDFGRGIGFYNIQEIKNLK
jgi:hypothetical protein